MGKKPKDVKSIFSEAVEKKDAKDRAAYLDQACGNDTRLRSRIAALLKAHEEAGDFLEVSALEADITLENCSVAEGPGTMVGRYKLLQLIGEGGFGVVYMAEQEKPIRRRVALKIIKLGMDTKQVIARFEAERQALALMDHPNIAQVFDASATDTGRPYFVMELVKGIPITEYCDKNKLDTRQRLELFIDVCKAVQHAHQKGIIHRDIKPSNVMITLHDGKPVPKIIDFGIAKATQQRLTEKTLFTNYQQFVGTPQYMSPEQAEMSGLDVDTRTDIYALGVLLYELLTGSTPFEAEKLRSAAYEEIRRIIRETDPPKPSTRLSTLGDALIDVAKHRQAQPDQLCKIVRGDLDWVVMKTLEKDRTRRYETANELARDIERHLSDEPVVAGPPGTAYRLRKFVRRHRTGVMFGLLVATALLISLCLATVGFVRASRAQARAENEREQARADFKLAREAVDAMTRAADQQLSRAPGEDQGGRQLLQEAEVFYRQLLENKSDEAAAREQVGLAYKRLAEIHHASGNNEQSEQACRQAVNVFEKLAEDFPETAKHRTNMVLAMSYLETPLHALGRDKEGTEIRAASHDMMKSLVRRFPHNSLYRKMFVEECRREGSRQSYDDAIASFEDLLADQPSCRYELAMLLIYYGTFLKSDGRIEEAREVNQKAEIIREELVALLPRLPSETRRLHMPWPYFGRLCLAHYKVRITRAGQYHLYMRSAGHDGPSSSFYAWIEELADGPGGIVADWYMCYAGGHAADFSVNAWRKLSHFERLRKRVRDSGPAVWNIATPGDYTITFAARNDGVAIDSFVFQLASLPAPDGDGPEESPMTKEKVFLSSDGRVIVEAEHFASRTPMDRNWLIVPEEDAGDTAHLNFRGTGYVQALPDMSPSHRQWVILYRKGEIQSKLGLWEEAIANYSEALAIMPAYKEALIGRGNAYAGSGQWNKAIADHSKAIELKPNSTSTWRSRARTYSKMGKWAEAIADHSKAIELEPNSSRCWYWRAETYREMQQGDKAIADYSKAIEHNPYKLVHWCQRAETYSKMGKWAEAIADYSKAIELAPDNLDEWGRGYGTGYLEVWDRSFGTGYWDAWERRFNAYVQLGQQDKALADYSQFIERNPNSAAARISRGKCYRNYLKDYAKALEDYSVAIELDPHNLPHIARRWYERAELYSRLKQYDKAIADYSKAIELDPENDYYRQQRIRAQQQMDQAGKSP